MAKKVNKISSDKRAIEPSWYFVWVIAFDKELYGDFTASVITTGKWPRLNNKLR